MKTETEFNDWLKKRLRNGRRGQRRTVIAKKMGMSPYVYSAYEKGDLKLTVYQLYQFMHASGRDHEFIKTIFDDNWHKPAQHVKAPAGVTIRD